MLLVAIFHDSCDCYGCHGSFCEGWRKAGCSESFQAQTRGGKNESPKTKLVERDISSSQCASIGAQMEALDSIGPFSYRRANFAYTSVRVPHPRKEGATTPKQLSVPIFSSQNHFAHPKGEMPACHFPDQLRRLIEMWWNVRVPCASRCTGEPACWRHQRRKQTKSCSRGWRAIQGASCHGKRFDSSEEGDAERIAMKHSWDGSFCISWPAFRCIAWCRLVQASRGPR